MRPSRLLRALGHVLLILPIAAGCAGGPLTMPAGSQAVRAPQSPMMAQYREMHTRAAGLDANNQNLHALLAQQQQQTAALQGALQRSQQEVASLRAREGAGEVASGGTAARTASHTGRAVTAASIPGAEVVQDGDLVRIRVDSGQLFAPGRADLRPEVSATLDRIAQALTGQYTGHLVGIEGHTDADPISKSKWKSNHELSVARATALFQALKSRGLPESRLFVAGFGPNRPVAANDSKSSKSRNRRVEIVVYPETAG